MGPAGVSSRPTQGERGQGGLQEWELAYDGLAKPTMSAANVCCVHCRVGLSDLQSILSTLMPAGGGESMLTDHMTVM